MKHPLAIAAIAALAVAGCATTPADQYAQADCKVKPITTTSPTNGRQQQAVSPERERLSQLEMRSSQYRAQELMRKGYVNNSVEEALRNCP